MARTADRRRPGPGAQPPSALPPGPDDATAPLLLTRPGIPDDPWSHRGGALSLPDPPPVDDRPSGPPGWLLGVVALLAIAAVAVVLGWALVVRPVISETASDRIRDAIDGQITRVAQNPDAGPVPAGDVVVTETEVNAYLDANAAAFDPLQDPSLDIAPGGLWFGFTLYRLDGAITGTPTVVDGRILVPDAEVHGPAGQFLTADDAGDLVADHLTAYLAALGLRPLALTLGDGSLSVETAPA